MRATAPVVAPNRQGGGSGAFQSRTKSEVAGLAEVIYNDSRTILLDNAAFRDGG